MAEQGYTVTRKPGYTRVIWSAAATGDTFTPFPVGDGGPAVGSVQARGTFNSTTIGLGASNFDPADDDFIAKADTGGTTIALTAEGASEFTIAMLHLKPTISGGSSDSVVVSVVLWG